VLFTATEPLARTVEAEAEVVLDYWAHRHYVAEPPGSATAQEISALFLAQPLSAEQRQECCTIIDTIFESMAEQFDLSLATAWRQKCVQQSRTLPPSRSSMIVARAVDLGDKPEQKVG
jgi:hypothetical protein